MVVAVSRRPRRRECPKQIGIRCSSVLSGSERTPIEKKTDLRTAAAIAGLFLASLALAEEQSVPFYPPEEAMDLSYRPRAYMVDETTCEWVQGQRLADGSLAGGGRKAALFRRDRLGRPFLKTETRADGVHVSRFHAYPGEVIIGRAYLIDPHTRRFVYGDVVEAACMAVRAKVGVPTPIET